MARLRVRVCVWYLAALLVGGPAAAWAQGPPATSPGAGSGTPQSSQPTPSRDLVFDMGEIVVIGSPEELPGVGGSL